MAGRWTVEDEELLWQLRGTMSIPEAADEIGRSEYAVRSYLKRKNIPWGRWARKSKKREVIELIRQRHVVLKAKVHFLTMRNLEAVVSLVEIVKMSGAKAVISGGHVTMCHDMKLIEEAAKWSGYVKSSVKSPRRPVLSSPDRTSPKVTVFKPKA
jgi:hypothetical protein